MSAAFMVQGAGSNVGKSVLVAGLCRYFTNQGLRVSPFKPQNMSNNAAVTADGGEIGRAQAMQARACNIAPTVHMNPVLLKPETETGSQIIVQGKRFGSMRAREYGSHKAALLPRVLDSYRIVEESADLVITEGAGSPAEVNLRAGDIANMGFAVAANLPVVMVGDIDRGGVIASLVGTKAVLDDQDNSQIKAFLINKFRGDTTLFNEGMRIIEDATDWAGIGILPWFEAARFLPAEDILDIHSKTGDYSVAGDPSAERTQSETSDDRPIHIAVPILRRIANFDDLDPLAAEPNVRLSLVNAGEVFPRDVDLILLPGSKATISDLAFIKEQGWDIDIAAHIRRSGRVMGLCGGYQMLGRAIHDPHGIEGPAGSGVGLGHLDVETTLGEVKTVTSVAAHSRIHNTPISGYEIHMGATTGGDTVRPLLDIDGRDEGATSQNGLVSGSYVHGIFADNAFRAAFLRDLAGEGSRQDGFGSLDFDGNVDMVLDQLADHLAAHLDMDKLAKIAGL